MLQNFILSACRQFLITREETLKQDKCTECTSESTPDFCSSCGDIKSKNSKITQIILGIALIIIAKFALSIEYKTVTPVILFIKITGGFLALTGLCIGFNAASRLIKSISMKHKKRKTDSGK